MCENGDGDDATYKLVGMVSHLGTSMSSGHYTFSQCKRDGRWTTYDDSVVTRDLEDLEVRHAKRAYILMYVKRR